MKIVCETMSSQKFFIMNEERKWCVYKHTAPNGKVYIGITSREPKVRWDSGSGYLQNTYFSRAIKKYGWKNIKHEIIILNLSENDAKNKEIELIKFYKSSDRDFGYNLTDGGEGTNGYHHSEETKNRIRLGNLGKKITKEQIEKWKMSRSWYKPTEETRLKQSMALKGKIRSIATRKNLSNSKLGRNNPMFNKHHSEESKNAMREKLTGRLVSDETRVKLSLLQKGKPKSEETKKKLSESLKTFMKNNHIDTRPKCLICIETGIVYRSMTFAEKETGISRKKIVDVCEGFRENADGFHWKFVDKGEFI